MQTNDLIASLVAEGAKKPLPSIYVQTFIAIAGIAVWLGFLTSLEGLRPDFAAKAVQPFYVAELILLALLSLGAIYAGLAFSRPDDMQRPWIRFVPLTLAAAWAVIAALGAPLPSTMPPMHEILNPKQFDCTFCILSVSIPPGFAMFWMVRSGAPVHKGWAGALTMLSITSMTYLFMRVIEQNDSPFHLFLFHVLPILTLCLVGTWAGKRFMKWE